MQCPCNPIKIYASCCAIAHNNISDVKTTEQLMRSRYSAFVLGDIEYLQISHHSTNRPSKKEARETERWMKTVDWIKLEVIQTTKGFEMDTSGTVEFKAFYLEDGRVEVIHEHSRFCKENGHWVYLNALT